jgi:capsular polysaccharide biosynthesis protein
MFAVVDDNGRLFDLPTSNPEASYARSFFPPRDSTGPRLPLGYIDEILTTTIAEDSHPSSWLAALAQHYPQEIFDLVDSPHGRFAAPTVADLMSTIPSNARWSDRFAMSAYGAAGQFFSDLAVLPVSTPNPSPQPGQNKLTIPEFSESGNVIHFRTGTTPMPMPSEEWLELKNATVQDGGTVRTSDGLIVYEESADPSADFVAGQWETIFGSAAHPELALLRERPPGEGSIETGILLSGRNDSNWFHWLIEYLPRVIMADQSIDATIPLLITNRIPATGLEALATLTSRPVIEIDASVSQRVNTLLVVAPPVQILDTTKVPWQDGLSMNPAPLLAMREAWRISSHERPTRRVFLRRNSPHRGLLNEAALAKIAEKHGLEIVDPGSLNFAKQVELFSSAELLVGASGAVMANYLLLSAGSRVIGLTSEGLSDFILPAAIASVAGATFTYLTGKPTQTLDQAADRNHWLILSSFRVDERAFDQCLKEELAQLT